MAAIADDPRRAAVAKYRASLLKCRELESLLSAGREDLKKAKKEFQKTEEHVKAFQSTGQQVAEVLRPLDKDRFIVKASAGPRYVTNCRSKLSREDLPTGTRVCLDPTVLTIMRILPREVDPLVFNMIHEDPGNVSFTAIGGLSEQIREVRETIELPLMNPELFIRVGIKPPKGVLLYGPPGTGKTLLARALASNIDANFMKVVSSAIIHKYIGESARIIREMFAYARDHEPCIIFMDEIDAIGGRRFSEGTSADREIQRTLMELLNQLDGFDELGKVKVIMATNRPDVLDPALLRPGRLDRKIEIPLPNEQSRLEILKIHAAGMAKHGEIDSAMAAALRSSSAADVRRALRISQAALSTLTSASRPSTVAPFSRLVPAISGANNAYSWNFRRLLSSKKKKRLLGSNKKPPLSAQNPEDFLQDLRDLELLGSHQIHLPLPAISDPEIETALKDLMAASWDELPHSLVEEAKKAVSKATDDVAGQEALKNVFRAAEACKEFGGVLVTLRVALDRYCGLTGLVSGPMPGYVEDAVRSTSDRYMTYLKSFRPDEIYLLRKVETELRKKVIHLRMRCSFIRREWLALTLYGMPPDS